MGNIFRGLNFRCLLYPQKSFNNELFQNYGRSKCINGHDISEYLSSIKHKIPDHCMDTDLFDAATWENIVELVQKKLLPSWQQNLLDLTSLAPLLGH